MEVVNQDIELYIRVKKFLTFAERVFGFSQEKFLERNGISGKEGLLKVLEWGEAFISNLELDLGVYESEIDEILKRIKVKGRGDTPYSESGIRTLFQLWRIFKKLYPDKITETLDDETLEKISTKFDIDFLKELAEKKDIYVFYIDPVSFQYATIGNIVLVGRLTDNPPLKLSIPPIVSQVAKEKLKDFLDKTKEEITIVEF